MSETVEADETFKPPLFLTVSADLVNTERHLIG